MFAILLISQAKIQERTVQKSIKVKQSYADINQDLINSVVDVIHSKVPSACSKFGFTPLKFEIEGNTLDYSESIVLSDGAPDTHLRASNRCSHPRFPLASGKRFYFCMMLGRDLAAPNDSIKNAEKAFAEFAVELISLPGQKPISCTEYVARKNDKLAGINRDGSAGLIVTMALYWENKVGKRSIFSQKVISYIANKN